MAVGPWTSVVSYHTDPESCGVAKFSAQLARRLGVELLDYSERFSWGDRPLLSVKFAEYVPAAHDWAHDQLWHDAPPEADLVRPGGRIWKLYELGVPALVDRPVMAPRALFTFGMAHKLELAAFQTVQFHYPRHQLWVSTAAHEGAGPSKVPDLLTLWGPSARDLGHLSDAALQLVWPHVDAFVAFFQGGLRPNNSSVHAALDAGVPVITNHGLGTPPGLARITNDYRQLVDGYRARPPATGTPYTWDRLLRELGCATIS